MMKFLLNSVSLILFFVLMFVIPMACEVPALEPEVSFSALVIGVDQNSIMVKPEEGSAELSSADQIIVYLSDVSILSVDNEKVDIDYIKEGLKVKIYYDGTIAESYPAQIHGASKVIVNGNND